MRTFSRSAQVVLLFTLPPLEYDPHRGPRPGAVEKSPSALQVTFNLPPCKGHPMERSHKEWYSRGYLPHFDHAGLIQMITFRLADALPVPLLETMEKSPSKIRPSLRRRVIESWLDSGYGSCSLRIPA